MKSNPFFFAAFLAASICASFGSRSPGSETDFELVPGELVPKVAMLPTPVNSSVDYALDESKLEKVNYYAFLPSDDSEKSDEGYPLMIFLHGIGERGDNVRALRNFGPVKICANPERAKTWKFLLIAPQCPDGHFWSPTQLMRLLDIVFAEYPVDKSRVYMTGLSLGGFGTWEFLGLYPEKLAAAAPICGGGKPGNAVKMKDVPIWAFHGDADPVVPCDFTRTMMKALLDAGAKDAHVTIYPGVGHNSWDKAYEEPELYDWLLSKKLGESNPSTPKAATSFDATTTDEPVEPGKMVRRVFKGKSGQNGSTLNYWLFVPTNESAKSDAGFPLLLFLHGSGERGTDLNVLKRYGPPQILSKEENVNAWKYLTVMPQCPSGRPWSVEQLNDFLDDLLSAYPIDPDRVYVTGVSMGGRGVWELLKYYPEKFAAAVPICGWGDLSAADKMLNVPIWAFHGENDPAVNCERSREMIAAIKKAGGKDAHITTYPGVGHNSWINAYANPELYEWLLLKKRGEDTSSFIPKTSNH